ncbi:gamma-butyrobetaine hydroxylase-like domain-containing protein [Pleionea sp. CnH1-48]|uniref:gamma-butyrobetaine hydroxylase-like domain-containing protein n=1 Tax=Pleionea sp. CnH1-48 TaxID=2954494 RepID=UPI0020971A2A|nr:DUF971 domain-containing protein [Pleionea sp. CnH1-48]MCO7224512.1 DUF971 domain-containing protein [Pleionea sp. CnH1-48]
MTEAPINIQFHQQSQILDIVYSDVSYHLSAEYLRVFSPSAEVRGHGGGPLKLIAGKKDVKIINIEPVGHYAVKLTFDDGHDSGLYTWQTFRELGEQHSDNWQHYLERLANEHLSREPNTVQYKKL